MNGWCWPEVQRPGEPTALAAGRGKQAEMTSMEVAHDFIHVLITWTTYGTWLPGDSRGWRRRLGGEQISQPLLERWCQARLRGEAVLLEEHDRATVHQACHEHCSFRGWSLLAINARTNHVHVVIATNYKPQVARDQLKANCTRMLRLQQTPLNVPRTWTRGGDCEILDGNESVEAAIQYVREGQSVRPAASL